MYSSKNLKNIQIEFSSLKYSGQQILKAFEQQLKELPGIGNLKNKGSSLRFDLFDTRIVIRIELPPEGIKKAGEVCVYFKKADGLESFELPEMTFINKFSLITGENSMHAGQGIIFILDNILPNIFNSRRIVFKNDLAEDPDSRIR